MKIQDRKSITTSIKCSQIKYCLDNIVVVKNENKKNRDFRIQTNDLSFMLIIEGATLQKLSEIYHQNKNDEIIEIVSNPELGKSKKQHGTNLPGCFLKKNVNSKGDNYLPYGFDIPSHYLLSWDPKAYSWDTLDLEFDEFNNTGKLSKQWGCGQSKKIKIGDYFYFLKVGEEPTGIMGSGLVTCEPKLTEHWGGIKNKKSLVVNIEFDTLIHPFLEAEKMLRKGALEKHQNLKTQNWRGRPSGIEVKLHKSDLERLWAEKALERQTFAKIQFEESIDKGFVNVVNGEKSDLLSESELANNKKRKPKINKSNSRNQTVPNYRISRHVLKLANFKCEYDPSHITFIGRATHQPFMEPHHLIPRSRQVDFPLQNIDIPENIVSLCPSCHRAIHHSERKLRRELVLKFYKLRIDKLKSCNLNILADDLLNYYDF